MEMEKITGHDQLRESFTKIAGIGGHSIKYHENSSGVITGVCVNGSCLLAVEIRLKMRNAEDGSEQWECLITGDDFGCTCKGGK